MYCLFHEIEEKFRLFSTKTFLYTTTYLQGHNYPLALVQSVELQCFQLCCITLLQLCTFSKKMFGYTTYIFTSYNITLVYSKPRLKIFLKCRNCILFFTWNSR